MINLIICIINQSLFMKNLYFSLFIVSLFFQPLAAQNSKEKLLENLKEYHSIPREVAYLHLNKSVLLQGEHLGFSAYIVNKNDLKPSRETTNLYVQVKNSAGEVVKQKLLLVESGVASNIVEIDSEFASGNYTISAFTNWMRNFDEQNYFVESFRVIESKLDSSYVEEEHREIDVQFLPESGHLLSGVVNSIGIIAKDDTGYGLPNGSVVVKDNQNRDLASIKLNQFGIGKFTMIPKAEEEYSAVVIQGKKEVPVSFDLPVEQEGIILTANQRGDQLRLLVTTNASSLPKMQKKPLILTVQNRSLVEGVELEFKEQKSIPVVLDLNTLSSGINIITLFDAAHNPIAERLIFNYAGLPVEKMQDSQITALQDSLEVRLPFQDLKKRSVSISILPENSLSGNSPHNIISYNLLQPYLQGSVENGGWYFQDVSEEKKFALDNLLLTQGWSSYDWEKIFNSEMTVKHKFEKNFELKAIIHSRDADKRGLKYLVHATANNNPLFAEIPSEKEAFIFDGFKPVEGEQVFISRIKRNDNLVPARLALQSFPQKFPYIRLEAPLLEQKLQPVKISGNRLMQVFRFAESIEQLNEVLLETKVDKVKERERKLGAHSYGSVNVVDNDDAVLYGTLANFLRAKGVRVTETAGTFSIKPMFGSTGGFRPESSESDLKDSPDPTTGASQGMAVYLDGVLMYDLSIFYQYNLASVDYIEINKTGMGNGFIGNAGHIKIYSKLESRYKNRDRTRIQEFDLPLAYSLEKQFYVPRYESTTDDFFKAYGVIDWKPGLTSQNGEDISFKIHKPKVDYKMIIEGFTEDGEFIYDVQNFSVEK